MNGGGTSARCRGCRSLLIAGACSNLGCFAEQPWMAVGVDPGAGDSIGVVATWHVGQNGEKTLVSMKTEDGHALYRRSGAVERTLAAPEQPTLSARLGYLKHGPGGSGLSGPCDVDCAKCKVESDAVVATVVVGDVVRWEILRGPAAPWIEGEVMFVSAAIGDNRTLKIKVARSKGYVVGQELVVGVCRAKLTRISRAVEQPAVEIPTDPASGILVPQTKEQWDEVMRRAGLDGGPPALIQDVSAVDTPDPLETKYNGVTLRELLAADERCRREANPRHNILTPIQRAAVSAHWSSELRARIAASKERERRTITVDYNEED